MDEALEIIRDYMEITKRTRTKYHVSECKEVVSKLQAHKAEIYELKQYNSSQMCKKCAYKDANDNLKALYCNSCFRNYVDNFEELDK